MAEYIEREALLHEIKMDIRPPFAVVRDFPAADVAEVKRGKWNCEPETINTLERLKCSECGWWTLDPSVDGVYHYCPNCGARMEKEATNNER